MTKDSNGALFLGQAHLILYPSVFTMSVPKGADPSKAQFSAVSILSGDEPNFAAFKKELQDELDRASNEKFGASVAEMTQRGKFTIPVKRNNDTSHGRAAKPGWAERPKGIWFSAATRFPVPVMDEQRMGMSKDREAEVYSGIFGQTMVSAWGWDHPTGGKGLSFNLLGLWKQYNGPRIGGVQADVGQLTDDGFVPAGAESAPTPNGADPAGSPGGDGGQPAPAGPAGGNDFGF